MNEEGPVRKSIREFFDARDYVVRAAIYPGTKSVPKRLGEVPFAIDDGETLYAVIFPNGDVKPFPIEWELDDGDAIDDEDVIIFSTLAPSTVPGGLLRYIPIRPDFEMPADDDYEFDNSLKQELLEPLPGEEFEFDGLEYFLDMFVDAKTAEPYTGVATLHWENGQIKKEAHFVDGDFEGKMTWWYENGQKELEDEYRESLRHGKHRAWHPNGERMSEGESVEGARQGTWRWWHDNGLLAEEAEYKDGYAHGKNEKWHANGVKALSTTFEMDVETGIHTEWYESGQLQLEVPMVDGRMNGTFRLWLENGVLAQEIEVADGEPVSQTDDKQSDHSLADDNDDADESAALVNATVEGDVDEVRRLLKEEGEPDQGTPAFVYAIVANKPDVFEVYVEHGTDLSRSFDWQNPDGSNVPGVNALFLAAAGGIMWAVERLMALGMDPNAETSIGQTALEVAIGGGQAEVVELLFSKMSDVSRPSAGRALVAAALTGNVDVISRCTRAGIAVDATDSRGWTALKYAVYNGHEEAARLLLENGADCNIADNDDWTPLLTAIENRDLEFVNLLLANGADPNAAPGDVGEVEQNGFSALMRAAHYGEVEILQALIAAGGDPHQTDSDGAAAIHYAALHREPECLEALLAHGADPNSTGADGHTAFGMFLVGLTTAAAAADEIDEDEALATMNLLLEHGGNWREAADHIVAEQEGLRVTLADAAGFALKEYGCERLIAAIDQART